MKSLTHVAARRFAAAAIFCLAAIPARAGLKEGPTAPDWTLKDIDGRTVRLADYRGKVVVINFWATWCAPCRQEIPGFVVLQKKYAASGLTFIGIALNDETSLVTSIAHELNVDYPVVFGTPATAAAYGAVSVLPATFIIDRDGKIVILHEGLVTAAAIEAEIKPLL